MNIGPTNTEPINVAPINAVAGLALLDRQPVAGETSSAAAWNRAWWDFVHFDADPFEALAPANRDDERFVLGPVFLAIYSMLAGLRADAPQVADAAAAARSRCGSDAREHTFVAAMDQIVAGEFTAAANSFDAWAHERQDFAAVRIAHDLYLHVGDNEGRLRSSTQALRHWTVGEPGTSLVAGMHAFSLNEVGETDLAERVARRALDADPRDLWARHALAHVYETIDDVDAGIDMLDGSRDIWVRQDSLAIHIWWHLALRHFAAGRVGAVVDIFDQTLPSADTAFRLSDLTSLLWRLELAGEHVGSRWTDLATRWAAMPDTHHTTAFLDVHAAMAFARCGGHGQALSPAAWRDDLARTWAASTSENAVIFRDVVAPLVDAVGAFAEGDHAGSIERFEMAWTKRHRMGGSNAQRDLLTMTRDAARIRSTPRFSTGDLP